VFKLGDPVLDKASILAAPHPSILD
jgi:hypothetical protein